MIIKNKTNPKLTIVGAGPGDAELITLKAIKALNTANVVLYDALVNTSLLEHAPESAIKLFVGKRNRNHEYTQEQINSLIIDFAFTHGHVVRLKGGDPFVFGRGQEEIKYAELFNIETAYVPGVSSSISVPGLAGISVTHRGISESFWVITATTKSGDLSLDVYKAAQTNTTAVILMGLNKLKSIVELYQHFYKYETPVAIIQNGSLPDEKIVLGTIDTIVEIVKEHQIYSPAIIVIGEVVKQHQDFYTFQNKLELIYN